VFSPPTGGAPADGPEPFFRGHERLVAAVAVLVLAVACWWLFVPPMVHRPSTAVWCPEVSSTPTEQRFDARRILGLEFADGHDLALQNGCAVRDVAGGVNDDERGARINVDVSRGVITRIDRIY
jgi:hypothetical protein